MNRHTEFAVGLSCLLVFWLAAHTSTAIAGTIQEEAFLNGAYSLSFPSNWEKEVDADLTVTLSPTKDFSSLLMIFPPDPDPEFQAVSIEVYSRFFMESFLGEGENGRIISEGKCTLNGQPAYSMAYSYYLEGMERIGGVYTMITSGYVFTIVGMVPMAELETWMPAISAAADTFVFNKANLDKLKRKLIEANAAE